MLDEAKKIFFPGGKSGHAKAQKLEFCECSLGNFTGTPLSLQDADFSISRYLSDNGLFASRVRFYLLTTAKNQDDLENIDSSCESVEKHSYALSSSNESSGNVVKSATDSGVESVSKSLLHIGDSKKSFVLEFCRHEISHYTSEASSLCVIGWADCYSSRSSKFLECEAKEYHPCNDNFIVWSITVDGKVYVQPDTNKDDSPQIMQDSYCFPMYDFEASEKPLILHQPDELYGHDSDNNLLIAVVTNFHNEVGVVYKWFVNNDVYTCGTSHSVIKVTFPGIYRCEIQYGEVKLTTESVEVFKRSIARYCFLVIVV